MSDVNFRNSNTRNNFLVITKTPEYGQDEANQHDVISLFQREQKASAGATDEFSKRPKVCAEAWGIQTKHCSECKIGCFVDRPII